LLLEKLNKENCRALRWIRISLSDDYTLQELGELGKVLTVIIPRLDFVDFSFSYLVTQNQNPDMQHKILQLAKSFNIFNVRFASDSHYSDKIDMNTVKRNIDKWGYDKISSVEQRIPDIADEKCYVHLLRPFCAADGYIYPCCGEQYNNKQKRDFSGGTCICHWSQYSKLTNKPRNTACKMCFAHHYNVMLNSIIEGVKHSEFL
jgi:hypothetical protein